MSRSKRSREDPVVPVTILTGFLGSGKTTLLNHILNDQNHGLRFAVIENEVGDVNVDEKVLSNRINEEIVEVMNGCICCSFRYDLVEALESLYEKVEHFDGLIIETTGLADPAPVVQTFFLNEDIMKRYRLDSVITVVDAVHILDRIREVKPTGTANEAVEQVGFADKIILNKIDLVKKPGTDRMNYDNDAEGVLVKIEEELKGINPLASVLRTSYSKIDPKELLHIQAFDLRRILKSDVNFLTAYKKPTHDKAVKSIAFQTTKDVNRDMLQAWINRLIEDEGHNLYRYKGVIAVKGIDNKYVFQGVGMLWNGEFQEPWRKNEKRETRFVFIGKDLDESLLKGGFQACQVSDDLRFAAGTLIEARIGRAYHEGVILCQWDEGHAYRIKLATSGREVWAPLDLDRYVRLAM